MLNLRQLIRKFGMVPLVVTLLSFPAAAQRVELFGGYQFTHLQPAFNANGWDASITGNFKHILGITGDFSGAYERGVHAYTYTGGPVLTARLPVVQPFVHALFGGMTVGGGTSSSTSGFTMMFGGGLDIGMRKGIGFRVVQADWISTNFSGTTSQSERSRFDRACSQVLKGDRPLFSPACFERLTLALSTGIPEKDCTKMLLRVGILAFPDRHVAHAEAHSP